MEVDVDQCPSRPGRDARARGRRANGSSGSARSSATRRRRIRAGVASDAQRSPLGEVRRTRRARCAVDVAELGARIGNVRVRVPAAAAEERRREPSPRRSHAPRASTRSPVPSLVGRAWSGAVQCVWCPSGPVSRRLAGPARARRRSSSPRAASAGRMSAAMRNPPGRCPAAPRTATTRRRREVAPRGRRRPRTVPPTWRPSSDDIRATLDSRPLVVAAAALPRLLVLARERETILEEFVDKSDRFAVTLVDHGTFGFLPGVPSAYTQPLYGWFLAGLYRPFGRSWLAVGLAQIAVAVVTALARPRDRLAPALTWIGLVAALLTTLHPYLVWHDVHLNRELLDGLAAGRARAVCVCSRTSDARSRWPRAPGAVAGVAILGNARLVLLPVALALYVAWRVRPGGPKRSPRRRSSSHGARSSSRPWVARNKIEVGCYAITTDSRALWKANNPNTRDVLDRGRLDRRRARSCRARRRGPSWRPTSRSPGSRRRSTSARRCGSTATRCSTSGASTRARRRGSQRQATRMLWNPIPTRVGRDAAAVRRATARRTVEPAFMVGLYVLAVGGPLPRAAPLRRARAPAPRLQHPRAMVFAGTARYRAPWDFLLALLAASRSRSSGSASDAARATRPRIRAQRGRAPRSARAALGRELARARARARRAPWPRARSRSPASATIAVRERLRVARRERRAPSRRPRRSRAARRRRSRSTGRARSIASSATIPKPSPSEGTTTIAASLDRRLHRGDEAEEAHGVVDPELLRVAP